MAEIRYTGSKPQFVDGIISDTEVWLKELISAPSSEAGIGKIYCKASDQQLYFKNGSGSETSLSVSDITLPNNFFNSSTPYYYDPGSVSLSNTIAISNIVAKSADNMQNIVCLPTTKNEQFSQWLFNEGSGTTVAEVNNNSLNFTTSGSVSWGSGFLEVDGISGSNSFSTANSTFSQLGSFSIALWFEFNQATDNHWFLAISNGVGTGNTNLSIGMTRQISGGLAARVSDGTNTSQATTNQDVVTGVKYLCILTYTRVGGVGNNILEFKFTSDGTTWYYASVNNAVLMQQNTTHELRNSIVSGTGNSANGKYYRLAIYPNKILTSDEMQAIYNLGSEASTSSYQTTTLVPTLADLNDSPRTWQFNETSGTTVFDASGVTDLTLSGSYTQTSSYLNIDGTNASNLISTGNGTLADLGSFSTVSWVEFNALPGGSAMIYGVCVNATSNANISWILRNTSSSVSLQISNGTTTTQAFSNLTLSTGVKYLIVTTYQRVGAGTSISNVSVTSNGVDWYRGSASNMVLMQQVTTHPFRNNQAANSLPGNNIRYHRVEIYNNKIIADSEAQDIWNAGSEVSFTQKYTTGVNSCAVSSNLSGTISSSTTTVTGTSTNFFKDFQIGDIIYSNGQGRRITAIASNTSLTIESSFAANLSARTYKRGGVARNTWYYLYAIGNGVTSGYIWSTRDVSEGDTLVDLPSGYTYRQTTCILKTDPSAILYNFQLTKGWPYCPTFQYKQTMPAVLTAGGSSGIISASGSIPNNSIQGEFLHTRGGTNAGSLFYLGKTASALNSIYYETARLNTVSGSLGTNPVFFVTDSSQNFYYQVPNGTETLTLTPFSYTITSNNII